MAEPAAALLPPASPALRLALRVLGPRLAQVAGTALLLATLCFGFVHALPGDLALRIAAARMGEDRLTPESAARVRLEEGLDAPLMMQYAAWLGRVAQGDLGRSLVSRRPVMQELRQAAGPTMLLGALGWALSYLVALPLGLWAGMRPGGWADRFTMVAAAALASLPPFLTGIGLIGAFALTLRWLPPAGSGSAAHLVLPAATLALGLAAYSVRILRHAVHEVRGAFYMTFARIRGLPGADAFRRHGVRNAAIPVATFAALQLAAVIDGFVLVETLFAYPGLGDLLVKSLLARDVPVVMGAALVLGLSYALLSLVADLVCLWLDPRRRALAVA